MDAAQWAAVTAATATAGLPRDDPTMWARFAAGIASPRLARLRLTRHPACGAWGAVDYQALLAAATAHCAGGG